MENKPIRFYGRRTARALKHQATVRYTHALKNYTFTPDKLESLLEKPLWLEIGFGGGEHLAHQARVNPDVNFMGAEAFCAGVAHMVGHIEENKLGNVWIYPDDVRLMLPHLPEGCLERVFLLFPDPWPKKRHSKRRFIQEDTMVLIASKLKSGGLWHIASDHPIYQAWVDEQLVNGNGKKLFELTQHYTTERPPLVVWPQTRYEQKALREGRSPHFWVFRKR